VERKEDMKRGLASPDVADGLALTFAYPVADLPESQATPGLDHFGTGSLQSDHDPHADL
jgi:hypothetical protein